MPIIGKTLGHKSLASTMIYSRLELDPVKASVDKATAAMLAAARMESLAPAEVKKK